MTNVSMTNCATLRRIANYGLNNGMTMKHGVGRKSCVGAALTDVYVCLPMAFLCRPPHF